MTINYGTFIPILAAIFCGGSGLAILVLAWKRHREEDITNTWQPAPGTILSSEVVQHRPVNPESKEENMFTPMVRYTYSWSGTSFTGYRLTFYQKEYSQSKARQIVSRYPSGNNVTVYFDPLHPDEAVLERNTRSFSLFIITGLMLCSAGMISCMISLLVYWMSTSGG